MLPACFRSYIDLFNRHANFSLSDPLQTPVALRNTLLPLLVSAGKPSCHQTAASQGPASLIVEVES